MKSAQLPRLHSLEDIESGIRLPAYTPAAHGPGIVHIGLGAFHRAHQAVYTDTALATAGGDWRIIAANLRSMELAQALNTQQGLYTLVEQEDDMAHYRVIGSLAEATAVAGQAELLLRWLTDPQIRIVSLTVTEKAYGLLHSGTIDNAHPDIVHDLQQPQAPRGVLGLLVEGLRRRWLQGIAPFTVLCCDNLPTNGRLVQAGVTAFARRLDPALADWIQQRVAFPSTMVDRITPAVTSSLLAQVADDCGYDDQAAVAAEGFSQWVIEDHFPSGRPAWEAGGALFVERVEPYEQMKLRMLNGTHSMLAYAGVLAGCTYVRDVMQHPTLRLRVEHHLQAAAATLEPLAGVDFSAYAQDLLKRFANPAIAHQTRQIAMDGTQKLPQRLLEPAVHALTHGQDLRPFAYAVAAWMAYCVRGCAQEGYALNDPREGEIRACLAGKQRLQEQASVLQTLPDLFPPALVENEAWSRLIESELSTHLQD